MGFWALVRFLSRLPVGGSAPGGWIDAVPWFPVAGALVGGVIGLLSALWFVLLPGWLAALAFVATYFGITGLLHIDGLADYADAALANGTPEARSRILRDPHVGTGGVVAVGLVVLGLYLAAAHFPLTRPLPFELTVLDQLTLPLGAHYAWSWALAIVVADVAANGAMVAALAVGRPSPESTLARSLAPSATRRNVAIALASGAALAVIFGGALGGVGLALGVGIGVLFTLGAEARLGGLGGDTLGAAHETTLLAVLLLFAVIAFAGG